MYIFLGLLGTVSFTSVFKVQRRVFSPSWINTVCFRIFWHFKFAFLGLLGRDLLICKSFYTSDEWLEIIHTNLYILKKLKQLKCSLLRILFLRGGGIYFERRGYIFERRGYIFGEEGLYFFRPGQFPNWNFVPLGSLVVKCPGCCSDVVGLIPGPNTCDGQHLGQELHWWHYS